MRGPLASFEEQYRSELLARGYTPLTAVNQLRQVSRLSCWLGAQGLDAAGVSEERIGEFLAFQRAGGRHRAQWSRPGLLCLLDVLRLAGASSVARKPGPPSGHPYRTPELRGTQVGVPDAGNAAQVGKPATTTPSRSLGCWALWRVRKVSVLQGLALESSERDQPWKSASSSRRSAIGVR
jgi:hypothetical protein